MTTGHLPFLPGGAPGEGGIVRVRLRNQADAALMEHIAPEDLLPGRTVHECIVSAASAAPDKTAIIHLDSALVSDPARAITYAELVDLINRAANAFVDLSGGQRPSVAALLPMVPEALITAWAGMTAGSSIPINPFLELQYIIAILNAAQVTILVTEREQYGAGAQARLDAIAARVPTLRRILVINSPNQAEDFHTILRAFPAKLAFRPPTRFREDASFLLTGGTTAAPKMIRMTHFGQLLNAWLCGALQGASADGVVGHAMPNFHVGGAIVIALRTIIFGQTLVTLTRDGFRNVGVIENFWDIARHHRMTAVLATPTTASALLAQPHGESRGHCIEAFGCGGSTVPLALVQAFHTRFGIWLREQWGMSEAHGTVTGHYIDGDKAPLVGSVGYRFPYYQVKAIEVDGENRFVRECAPGERGVLVIGGEIIPGYRDAHRDADFFVRDMPEHGSWGNTGDLGSVDAQGYVWIYGRIKDLIVRGGHNIDPKLIEEALNNHPSVQLAAAVGRPDGRKGELPVAYVQLREDSRTSPDELLSHCRQHIQERAAIPVDIVILDQIPNTAAGKISKPALRLDALRRVISTVIAETLGAETETSFTIDETAQRPVVVIRCPDAIDRSGNAARIAAAFRGFEFAVSVE